MAPMSLSHTFGNMTAFITEFIKGLFPKNYFRTVNVTTTMAYRYFNIFDNTNKEFFKNMKPMLIIRPRIDPNDTDVFLNGTMLTSRITDNAYDLDYGNLQPFFSDPDLGRQMRFLMNRMKMFFDVTIVLESQMEQMNQFMYLRNAVRQEHPFYIETSLESNIPRGLMDLVLKDVNIDISTSVKPFLDYLNSISVYPVTYKLKNSTGRDEFFQYYPALIDASITGLSMDEGSKKGVVNGSYPVNFTVSTEFQTSGLYYYFTQNPNVIDQVVFDFGDKDDNTIMPIFTISNLFTVKPPTGWSLYGAPFFKVTTDDTPDMLGLSDIILDSIKSVITYCLDNGIDVSTILAINIMKDNVKLDPANSDYSIDWSTLEVTVNQTNSESTYRLIIYVNSLYINNLVVSINKEDEEK